MNPPLSAEANSLNHVLYYSFVTRTSPKQAPAQTALNTGRDTALDRVFGALSNGTRRRMLQRLAQGPASISELAQPFAMSLPAVSSHIRVLEAAGLLTRRRDGRVQHCTLEAAPLGDVAALVASYRGYWEDTLEALARYAEAPEATPSNAAAASPSTPIDES